MQKRLREISAHARNPRNEPPTKYLKVRSRQETDIFIHCGDRTRWQRFKAALFPYLRRSKELADAYDEAKVEKERSEARKIAEEADKIAAKRDLIRQKSAKEFGDVVDDIFMVDSLPLGARALKLAKLIEKNPNVFAQLEKAEEVIESLAFKKVLRVEIVDKSKKTFFGEEEGKE